MSLHLVREILEDADIYSHIKCGAYADTYDTCAEYIFQRMSKDLSIEQIQSIIWDSFYNYICVNVVPGENEPWVLDRGQARVILGSSGRFKGIALNIRYMLFGL